jgi:lysyl-tRNA synthetase class 2
VSKSPDPYPHKFDVNTPLSDFISKYSHLKSGETLPDVEIRIGLRVMTMRSAGTSLRFYDCKSEGVAVQIFCDLRNASGNPDVQAFSEHHNMFKRGDIIGVIGYPGRTKPRGRPDGELSVFAKEVVLLTPCLRQVITTTSDIHFSHANTESAARCALRIHKS